MTEATPLTLATSTSTPEFSYSSRQSLGKAVAHSIRTLSKTPHKKKQVLSKIVSTLSPCSKTALFTSTGRKLDHNSILGWPKISSELRETVVSFLEKPDVSYCKPGRKDLVYIGKDENEESHYWLRHYMLWTFKEIVSMFNSEHYDCITYCTVQKTISEEKLLLQSAWTPEDNCRCEKCENVELLLKAIKTSLNKAGKNNVPFKLAIDSSEFVTSIVCSVKSHDCCKDICSNCPRRDMLNEVILHLKSLPEVTYNKWVQRNNI